MSHFRLLRRFRPDLQMPYHDEIVLSRVLVLVEPTGFFAFFLDHFVKEYQLIIN